MGHLCESPFDGDANFDIDMKEELEINIWMASVTLESWRKQNFVAQIYEINFETYFVHISLKVQINNL